MIKNTDLLVITHAKLRTHKIRTGVTVLLASLLFGALISISLITTGGLRSVEQFREDGLTGRYIVSVTPAPKQNETQSTMRDPALVDAAKDRYKKLVDEKTAEANKLNLPYSQALDAPPYAKSTDGKGDRLQFTDPNGIVNDILKNKFGQEPAINDTELLAVANSYHATRLFHSTHYAVPTDSSLEAFADGKEIFYDRSDQEETNASYRKSLIDGSSLPIVPDEIIASFLLPGAAGWQPDGDSLPIVLPQNIVEQLLDLKSPADNSSPEVKLNYLKNLRKQAADLSVQACYRNSASLSLIQQTIQQDKEIKANIDNKDYKKPSLIYELPDAKSCKNPTITSDQRTKDEIKHDDNQAIFDKKFGNTTDPLSHFVTFKIVGISPIQTDEPRQNMPKQAANLGEIIDELLSTNSIGQAIPKNLYEKLSDEHKVQYEDILTYQPTYIFGREDNKQRFVEFANSSDAQKFIDDQGCTTQIDNTCAPAGRSYQLALAFTNSSALSDSQQKASNVLIYSTLIVVAFAVLIMWITIGRTITDSRRETAVLRAIGFKRIDITLIYTTYTIILSLFVTLFSLGIGFATATVADHTLSPDLTARAQYAFGGLDTAKQFTLIGVDAHQLTLIVVACMITGLLSVIMPLALNVRRNPIRDMRED